MRAFFTMLLSPIFMSWAFMESKIWISMAVLAALAGVAFAFKAYLTVCLFLSLFSFLLMRVDAIKDEAAAAAAADTQ